jgi:predicted O-methyltransferase YrrM
MKEFFRTLWFRSGFFRNAVNLIYWLAHPKCRPGVGHLVTMREEDAYGPVQREEALFLFGIIQAARPKTVVEFGFHGGRSAFNFLQALPQDAQLYSYDISDGSQRIAEECFRGFSNFHFLKKSQELFSPDDIERRPVDFVFIDAAHDLELNKTTFKALLPCLDPAAIVAVHDTGTWSKEHFFPIHKALAEKRPQDWLNENEFQHQKEEREFVNWIGATFPDFQIIHFHSKDCLRHGTTLLQRKRTLDTGH